MKLLHHIAMYLYVVVAERKWRINKVHAIKGYEEALDRLGLSRQEAKNWLDTYSRMREAERIARKDTMTSEEYNEALDRLGLSRSEATEWLGVSKRTSINYATGRYEIPAAVTRLIRLVEACQLSPEEATALIGKLRKDTMSARQFNEALDRFGLSRSEAADWLGISKRTAVNYALGTYEVPGPTARFIRLVEALGLTPEKATARIERAK